MNNDEFPTWSEMSWPGKILIGTILLCLAARVLSCTAIEIRKEQIEAGAGK